MIDRLVQSGHVIRKHHETDRRIVLVEITETGKAILKQAEDVQKEVIARGLSQLPPKKCDILVSAFEKLTSLLLISSYIKGVVQVENIQKTASEKSIEAAAPELKNRGLLLTGLIIAMLFGALDGTIVGTAMPRIVGEFGGLGLMAWLTTAYMLTSTVVVPIAGKLG